MSSAVAAPPRTHTSITLIVLAVSALAYALLQSLVAPALPNIQASLDASPSATSWILTAYLLSASITTPILGRFGDMFGKERMLVIVLSLLALGTVISALGNTVGIVIIGRVVQGFGGAVFPLSFAIIRDEFPSDRVPTAIALVSAIMGIGAGLGIVLAGPVVEHLSYHWLFWFPGIVVAAAAVAAWRFVPESPIKTPGSINWLGALFLSAWLTTLLVGVTKASDWGWGSGRFLGAIAAAIVFAVLWVVVERRAKEPLVDMHMLQLRGVWTTNLAGLLTGFAMFASFILIPQLMELPEATGIGFGMSVTGAGLAMLPSTLAMLLVAPVVGRIVNRWGGKPALIAGSLILSLAFVLLALFHSETWHIYVTSAITGIGIGMAFASMANLVVMAVPPEQTGVASGMNTITRTIGGGFGSQIMATVIAANLAVVPALDVEAPTEHAFVLGFVIAAGVAAAAAVAASFVPKRAPATTERDATATLEPANASTHSHA
ncbi:MAG: transporter [Thermoleophilia bacterium]|nr:transporter [Thermoleophilia bacterium]